MRPHFTQREAIKSWIRRPSSRLSRTKRRGPDARKGFRSHPSERATCARRGRIFFANPFGSPRMTRLRRRGCLSRVRLLPHTSADASIQSARAFSNASESRKLSIQFIGGVGVSLEGKVALVTGASRGIGRSTALALARAGADLAVNYCAHADEAQQTAEEIRALGRRALVAQTDVADQTAVEGMLEQAIERFGRIDVAVSNAAYSDREFFYQASMEGFRRSIDVTMWGAFYLLRAATRQMIEQGEGGSIVIVSSPHAFVAVPQSMAYNMAKAAIDQMARTAAIELVDHRIRVNIVHPGWVDTPGERKFATEEQIRAAASKMPWKRLGRPEEIGRAIAFLCDPESDYITGSALLVDGGITLPWWSNRGSGVPE